MEHGNTARSTGQIEKYGSIVLSSKQPTEILTTNDENEPIDITPLDIRSIIPTSWQDSSNVAPIPHPTPSRTEQKSVTLLYVDKRNYGNTTIDASQHTQTVERTKEDEPRAILGAIDTHENDFWKWFVTLIALLFGLTVLTMNYDNNRNRYERQPTNSYTSYPIREPLR